MNRTFTIPRIDGILLNRLLRKESIEIAVFWSRITLIALCVLLLALIAHAAITAVLDVNTTVHASTNLLEEQLEKNSAALATRENTSDTAFLRTNSPFGTIGAKESTVMPTESAPKVTTMALTLIGTFITSGQAPYAIIEDTKKNSQEVFNINDTIFEEATLVGVYPKYVEIRRNEQIEILKLDDSSLDGSGGDGAASDFVNVDESELNQALDNLPLLLTQARAVPYFKDGRAIGLRLFAIKNGSLYEKIGLKNGDILKSINGNSLGDITQAVKLFEKLREERSVALVLERNRAEQTIRYEIR